MVERQLNRYYGTLSSRVSLNQMFDLIEPAIVTAFTEDAIRHNPELLEKCYVTSADRIRFDRRIKMHIVRRDTVLAKAPARPLRDSPPSYLSDKVRDSAREGRSVAILVTGLVGAGKTTFLDYTRQVAATSYFKPSLSGPYPHWIYMDLRELGPDANPLDFIYFELRKYIDQDGFLSDYERCLKYAYRNQIDALFRGPLSLLSDDKSERARRTSQLILDEYTLTKPYVDKVLAYASKNTQMFLVIDNVDQFEDDSFQERIFGDAMALGRKLGLNLILSLREGTYVRHRNLPILDAFDFDPITIDSPDVKAVLARRFFVARGLLEGRGGEFTAENGARIVVDNLSQIIDILRESVLGTEIGNLIEVFATGDIRNALRMTREFLRTGYSAPGRAIQVHQRGRRYVMPRHEALRAIMLGSRRVYQEEYSPVGNIFDARVSQTSAQMVRLFVMNGIVNMASMASFRGVAGESLEAACRAIGIGDLYVKRVLKDLTELRFVFTMSHAEPTAEASYIPSRLGGYAVRELICDVMYLENVLYDTFVADDSVWSGLRNLTDQIQGQRNVIQRVKLRMMRVRLFHEYVWSLYRLLADEAGRRGLRPEWLSDPFAATQSRFEANLRWVERSAERNYGPEAGSEN